MEKPVIKIPFTELQKDILGLGFLTVKEALAEEDNPFPECVANALSEFNLKKVHELMDRFRDMQDDYILSLGSTDCLPFYFLVDITRHVLMSDYFLHFMKDRDISIVSDTEYMASLKKTIYLSSLRMLANMKEWEKSNVIKNYLFSARSFPDLMTGVSYKLAAYNHIPNIPNNPPQLDFRNYDDDEGITYNIRANRAEFLKNLNCLVTFLLILRDKENPPAKMLTAYFPNLERYISEVIDKIAIKDKRRKKVMLTTGEYGVLYACTDLFGRLRASSYNNLIKKIEKETVFENFTADVESKFIEENNKSSLMSTVEQSLKLNNENFGDYAVIKDYRAFTAQMIGFDD